MNVKEIIINYLKENGYDGLVWPGECGCKLDDLMPCDNQGVDCEPAFLLDCKKCMFDKNSCDMGFCMSAKKPGNEPGGEICPECGYTTPEHRHGCSEYYNGR